MEQIIGRMTVQQFNDTTRLWSHREWLFFAAERLRGIELENVSVECKAEITMIAAMLDKIAQAKSLDEKPFAE